MNSTREQAVAVIPAGAVVIGVDEGASAAQALEWGAELAARQRRPVVLAHAAGLLGTVGTTWLNEASATVDGETLMEAAVREMETRAERLRSHHPDLDVTTVVRFTEAAPLLLELAEQAHLVVVGSRGFGRVRSLLLGSVGVALASRAASPVVVVRPHNPGEVRRGVLVGVDEQDRSPAALEFAFAQADLHDWPLTVVHAVPLAVVTPGGPFLVTPGSPYENVDPADERRFLTEAVAGMRDRYPDVRVDLEVVRGFPDRELTELGRDRHLVVVGRHRGGRLAKALLGDTGRSVVENAATAVAVVPED